MNAGDKLKRHILFGLAIFGLLSVPGHAIILPLDQLPREFGPAATAKPSDLAYQDGIEALNRKDWAAAKAAFDKSLLADPKNVDSMLGLAHVAAQQNKPSEAEDWLKKAMASNPQSASVQVSWGRYLISTQRYSEAEATLKKAALLDPQALAPALALGDLYSGRLNNPKAAAAAFRQATRIDPQHAGAQHGLGMSLLATGQFAESESALKKALTLAKDNPLPKLSLGRVYLAQGKFTEAVQLFGEILDGNRNLPAALIGRGDGHFGKLDFQTAAKDYQHAIQLAPKNAEAHLKLGMSLQAQQKPAAAEQHYLAAIQIDPRLAIAYNNLAWMAAKNRKRSPQAIRWAEKAVSLAPDSAEFHDTLGWSYYQAGKLEQAKSTLEKALAKGAASADVHYHLGMVWVGLKNDQGAKAAFLKALAIQKNHAAAKTALAELP